MQEVDIVLECEIDQLIKIRPPFEWVFRPDRELYMRGADPLQLIGHGAALGDHDGVPAGGDKRPRDINRAAFHTAGAQCWQYLHHGRDLAVQWRPKGLEIAASAAGIGRSGPWLKHVVQWRIIRIDIRA